MRQMLFVVVTALSVLVNCSFRETHARCRTTADCSVGEQCYLAFCVTADAGLSTVTAPEAAAPASTGVAAQSVSETTTCESASSLSASEGACCVAKTACYEGPDGTLDVGACKAGERACVDGKFAACSDSIAPRSEACDNPGTDDDCNGKVDDLPRLGETCTRMSSFGPCGEGRLACVDGKSELQCVRAQGSDNELCNDQDDDCDGQIDEGFDISGDRANCGKCGNTCAAAELCCGGRCLAMAAASESGCPSCSSENPCAETASCCGGACRDLKRDRRHCGACGHSCEQAQRCCEGTCQATCN